MKNHIKRIFACLLLLTVTLPREAFSQAAPVSAVTGTHFQLGLKLGAHMGKMTGLPWDQPYVAGYLGGAFASVRVRNLGVQAEALFSSMRFHPGTESVYGRLIDQGHSNLFKDTSGARAAKGDFLITRLHIPLLLQFHLGPFLVIQAGPQYSGVLAVQEKEDFLRDAGALFAQGDLGGVLGLQVNLGKRLHLGGRYIIGFSDQNNLNANDAWKTRDLQFHLGYSFL